MVTPSKRELLDDLISLLLRAKAPSGSRVAVSAVPGDFGDLGQAAAENFRQKVVEKAWWGISQQIGLLSEKSIPLGPATVVGPGAIVSFLRLPQEAVETVFLLPTGGGEVLSGGIRVITPSTPLGKAFMGCKAGDVVQVNIPIGIRQQIKIVSVE